MLVKQLKDKDGTAIQPVAPDKVGYFQLAGLIDLPWNTVNTVPEDGWIRCYGLIQSDRIVLEYNGGGIWATRGNDTADVEFSSPLIPIKKGFTIRGVGSGSSLILNFYQNRAGTN